MAPTRGALPINPETPAMYIAGVSFCIPKISQVFLGALLTSLLFSSITYGNTDIVVSGDHIDYDTNSKNLVASQNVEITFGQHQLHTNHSTFNIVSQNIKIQSPFTYEHQGIRVIGSKMIYNFQNHNGNIKNVQATIENAHISGSELDIDDTRLALHNLRFTTCNKPTPDYEVHSELVHFYPQVGFMVAFNNTIHTQFLPFPLWIPTYIYGSRSYSIIGSSSAMPEIGANNREGLYAKYRIGYFFNTHSTGTLDLGWYIERGGFLYGFTHLLETSQTSEVHLEAHMVGRDGFEGLAAYYTDIFTEEKTETTDITDATDATESDEMDSPLFSILNDFQEPLEKRLSRLHLGVSHRKLINDSRVTQLPFAKIVVNETPLVDSWRLSGDVGWASGKEETPTYAFIEDQNTHLELTIGKVYGLAPSTNFGITLVSNNNWYGTGKTWQRLFSAFHLDFKAFDTQPRIFYIKKLMNPYGESPFEYEKKYAMVSDEIGTRVETPWLGLEWGYEAFYDLERKELRTQNIKTSFLFDCWKLSIQANTIAGNFSFGVELL
jgi:hypothetical protein